jgi:hypothetical protein
MGSGLLVSGGLVALNRVAKGTIDGSCVKFQILSHAMHGELTCCENMGEKLYVG